MDEAQPPVEFVGAEGQGNYNNALQFPQLVMLQMQRINALGSVEFRGGIWQERVKVINGMSLLEKEYLPSTAAAWENGVFTLFDMLSPHFDKEAKVAISQWEIERKQLDMNLFQHYSKSDVNGVRVWISEEKYNVEKVKQSMRPLLRILQDFLKRVGYFGQESAESF